MTGTVYLLHFDRAFGHAKHYTGWAADLDARLAQHLRGNGARLLAVVHAAGIGWTLARTWPGDRARERDLKRQGGASRRCPLCGVKPRQEPRSLPRNKDGSLSRSRTTNAEKAAAGVMTSAQQAAHTALRKGAVRGRVPGVARLLQVPDSDEWYAPAAGGAR